MRNPAALVRLDDVSKTFRNGTVDTRVLCHASLDLFPGETTSLVGVSGSGKSTLLSLLAGLLTPDSGRVLVDENDIAQLDESARARLRAHRIGIVLQSGNLIPFLSAIENVELAIGLAGGARRSARARDLLGELGLGARLHHRARRLSGGEAQRVAVAIALANDPDLLLADEATGELDSSSAEQVTRLIAEASHLRGLAVLYVTHSSELAARAQHRFRMVEGEVRSE